MELWQLVGAVIIVIIGYFSHRLYKFLNKFKDRGFKVVEPRNFLRFIKREITIGQGNEAVYSQLKKHRYGAVYQLGQYAVMVTDPELVQNILIKDFSHFHDHGETETDMKTNPMDANLFSLQGGDWRALRYKLAPVFTSGKLRWMFDVMADCGDILVQHLSSNQLDHDTDVKEIFARYCTDIIASCAFGIDGQALKDPDSKFLQMAKHIFDPPDFKTQMFKALFRLFFPKLFKMLKIKAINPEIEQFFISITKQGFEHRVRTGEKRNDFLQLLLELREKGSVELEPGWQSMAPPASDDDIPKLEMSDELLAAQAFVFFIAGFENPALAMALTCYYLSTHPEAQLRVREEMRTAISKHGGLTYEALKEMKYLDACIDETQRLMPIAEAIFRRCNKRYPLGDGRYIDEGDSVVVPVWSLHHDPDLHPEPELFKPERFLGQSPPPGTYMPFGDGPRICIAQRFALLEIKIGVCKLLEKFQISKSGKNIEPIKMSPKKFAQIEGGLWIKLEKIEPSTQN